MLAPGATPLTLTNSADDPAPLEDAFAPGAPTQEDRIIIEQLQRLLANSQWSPALEAVGLGLAKRQHRLALRALFERLEQSVVDRITRRYHVKLVLQGCEYGRLKQVEVLLVEAEESRQGLLLVSVLIGGDC